MKNTIIILMVGLFLSCTGDFKDVVDFTDVQNPNLSEESVVGQPNSSKIWATGIERQLSRTFNEILILAELGSDNYVNTQTFYNQFLDGLDIRTTDPDIRDTQNEIARIGKMALFGLEEVGPNDPTYTTETEAEFHFYLGLSQLFAGMYFAALPQETLGVPIGFEENYQSAIESFEQAAEISPKAEYYLARARAEYYLGNKAEAVSAATSALGMDGSLLRSALFDELNTPSNIMDLALYQRATFDDLQPLPTLDFLDPKYSFVSADVDAPVHYLKAEEAYLILAEASLSDSNIGAAQGYLETLLELVATREVRSINDQQEGRTQAANGSRPDSTHVVVNGREGLVLYRGGDNVMVPSVSGTSLTASDISTMTIGDAALELLYRTRQEIFIAEGLRFVDMGVKLVINENEILQNDNVSEGDYGTVAVIPDFIESVIPNLDAITYDAASGTASTVLDMNALLVANKSSAEVLPFH